MANQPSPFVHTSIVEGNHKKRQDEMGNYFVLNVSGNVADCQIARVQLAGLGGPSDALVFSDFFWEFEDDRVMYLMFNNYGFNSTNARQIAHGAAAWETRTKPEPLCFAFRAGDSFARLSIGNHVEMVVKYEHLIRYGFTAAMNPLFEQEVMRPKS